MKIIYFKSTFDANYGKLSSKYNAIFSVPRSSYWFLEALNRNICGKHLTEKGGVAILVNISVTSFLDSIIELSETVLVMSQKEFNLLFVLFECNWDYGITRHDDLIIIHNPSRIQTERKENEIPFVTSLAHLFWLNSRVKKRGYCDQFCNTTLLCLISTSDIFIWSS